MCESPKGKMERGKRNLNESRVRKVPRSEISSTPLNGRRAERGKDLCYRKGSLEVVDGSPFKVRKAAVERAAVDRAGVEDVETERKERTLRTFGGEGRSATEPCEQGGPRG